MFSKGTEIWCGSTTNAFYSQQGCCSGPPSSGCSLTFWVDALSPSSLWMNGHVCERAGWVEDVAWDCGMSLFLGDFSVVFPVWRPALSMGELDSWLKIHSISHFPRRCPHYSVPIADVRVPHIWREMEELCGLYSNQRTPESYIYEVPSKLQN